MAKSYYEKLKDPRWQKLRLAVFERDCFACVSCNTKDKTLHIHHGYYHPKIKSPWDYAPDSLWTLCEDCHTKATAMQTEINAMIGNMAPTATVLAFVWSQVRAVYEFHWNDYLGDSTSERITKRAVDRFDRCDGHEIDIDRQEAERGDGR